MVKKIEQHETEKRALDEKKNDAHLFISELNLLKKQLVKEKKNNNLARFELDLLKKRLLIETKDNISLKDELNLFKKQLSEEKENKAFLNSELNLMKEQVLEEQKNNISLNSVLSSVRCQLLNEKEHNSLLRSELNSDKRQLSSSTEVSSLMSELDLIKRQLQTERKNNYSVQFELDITKRSLLNEQTKNGVLLSELSSVRNQQLSNEEQNDVLLKQLNTVENRLLSEHKNNDLLSSELGAMRERLLEEQKNSDVLNSKLNSVQSQLSDERKSGVLLSSELDAMRERLLEEQKNSNILNSKLSSAQSQLSDERKSSVLLNHELDSIKSELLNVKNDRATLISSLDEKCEKEKKDIEKKIKNQLSYRLGVILVKNGKSVRGIFGIPFKMYREYQKFKRDLNKRNECEISVVIPAYNCEKYICDCIDSLLAQTFKNFEIIVVDDGSTDKTYSILKQYEKKYDHIKIYQQQNQYAGVARNTGLKYAKGRFILFLDADDFFDKDMLRKSYERINSTGCDIVVFNAQEYDTVSKKFQPCKFPVSPSLYPKKLVAQPEDFGEKIFQANSSVPWNKLIRRSLIDRVKVKFSATKSSTDTVFIFSLLTQAKGISLIDEILVNYRVNNPDSLQRSKDSSWESICVAYFELKKKLIELGVYEQHKRTFANKALQACLYYLSTVSEETKKKMACSLQNKYFKLLDMKDLQKDYIYNKSFYQKYLEIKEKLYIPIVYSLDDSYVKYTAVSMSSVLSNVSSDEIPMFFILKDSNLSKKSMDTLTKILEEHKGEYIEFIDVEDKLGSLKSNIKHITIQTYYRLLIPTLLKYLDKLIYLDGDTVVNGNIRELFTQDIRDSYFAGVIAPAFVNKKHEQRLGISTQHYVNAGVLFINNRLLIKDKMQEKFLEMIKLDYDCMDQDILNVACRNKITLIPPQFNFMTKYLKEIEIWIQKGFYTREQIDSIMQNPYIIHYADKVKPWDDENSFLAKYFWDYAKKTGLF